MSFIHNLQVVAGYVAGGVFPGDGDVLLDDHSSGLGSCGGF